MVNLRQRNCIYLVCAAGTPNAGDDLICLVSIKTLRALRSDARSYVDCPNPANLTLLLDRFGLATGVSVVDFLWRLAFRCGASGFYEGQFGITAGDSKPGAAGSNLYCRDWNASARASESFTSWVEDIWPTSGRRACFCWWQALP